MGNFIGHFAPGIYLVFWSIWWTLNLLKYHFQNLKRKNDFSIKHKIDYRNAWTKPWETVIIAVIVFITAIGEYLTGFENGPLICPDNFQHITIYLTIFIICVVNLLEISSILPIHVPLDALYGIFSFVEILIFYFHVHHQGHFEQHLHKLLVLTCFCCCILSFISSFNQNNLVIHLAKFLFYFLLGTWFIHIAFIMYPILGNTTFVHDQVKNPNNDLHRTIMITTALYCLQLCFSILFFVYITIISFKKYYNSDLKINPKYQGLLEESANN